MTYLWIFLKDMLGTFIFGFSLALILSLCKVFDLSQSTILIILLVAALSGLYGALSKYLKDNYVD